MEEAIDQRCSVAMQRGLSCTEKTHVVVVSNFSMACAFSEQESIAFSI